MHGWVCDQPTGVEALRWRELPMPHPKPGEVLVEVKAASLNFPDLLMVQNKYQIKPALPFVPGTEYAGVVAAVGDGVTHVRAGQNVAVRSGTGGFGTHAIAAGVFCTPLPSGVPHVDAAALFVTYATSHHALIDRGDLKPGETVLILGAAGGVGTAAIEISRLKGATVIAAASSEEKCALCESLGAHATISYGSSNSREAFRDAIAQATSGKGPDVIYDPVGGLLAEPAFRSIAWRGRYLVVGFAAGEIPKFALNLALLKGASIIGVIWGTYARKEPEAGAAVLQELTEWYMQGKIRPVIDRTMPMAELKAAYAHMASRGVMGKVVMVN